MATNPLIALTGQRPVNFGGLLDQAENRRTARTRREIAEAEEARRVEAEPGIREQRAAQTEALEQRNEAQRLQMDQSMAKITAAHVTSLLAEADPDKRRALHSRFESIVGYDLDGDGEPDELDDQTLLNTLSVLNAQSVSMQRLKPIGTPFPTTKNGKNFLSQQVQNLDGTIGLVETELPGDILDRQGRTGEARVKEAGDTATVKQEAQTVGFEDRREVEEETAAGIAEEGARGASIQKSRDEDIALGKDAAKGIPTLRRGIELLQFVETGGYNAALIRAKQFFGVEAADEGELAANLGKAVLSQLRATFGAQFTQQEGERLQNIEARMGANTDTNIRLLRNALQTAVGAAERGIEAAVEARDFRTAQNIQNQMDAVMGEPTPPQFQEGQTATGPNGEKIIFQGGQWVPMQ